MEFMLLVHVSERLCELRQQLASKDAPFSAAHITATVNSIGSSTALKCRLSLIWALVATSDVSDSQLVKIMKEQQI